MSKKLQEMRLLYTCSLGHLEEAFQLRRTIHFQQIKLSQVQRDKIPLRSQRDIMYHSSHRQLQCKQEAQDERGEAEGEEEDRLVIEDESIQMKLSKRIDMRTSLSKTLNQMIQSIKYSSVFGDDQILDPFCDAHQQHEPGARLTTMTTSNLSDELGVKMNLSQANRNAQYHHDGEENQHGFTRLNHEDFAGLKMDRSQYSGNRSLNDTSEDRTPNDHDPLNIFQYLQE